jgi:hypothetical protein
MVKPNVRKYLEQLAQNEDLINTVGDQSRRMVDQELVLRYLAFHYMNYEKSRKNIATFLDEMIKTLESSSDERLIEFKKSFQLAIGRCWDVFEEAAFEKNSNGQRRRRRRKNSTLFEVWTTALARLSEEEMNTICQRKESLKQKHQTLMTEDNDYIRSITYSTQKKEHYRIRRDKVFQIIQEVLHA